MSERVQQIIDATQRLLQTGGLQAVTMRAVAAEVGVSAPALYRHFDDRDAMVRAVLTQAGERFASSLFRALAATGPVEQLAETGLQYLRFAFEQQALFELLFGEWRTLDVKVHGAVPAGAVSPSLQFLVDRVTAILGPGLSREEALDLALEQWALVHGLAMLYLRGGGSQLMSREQYEARCAVIVHRAAARLTTERR